MTDKFLFKLCQDNNNYSVNDNYSEWIWMLRIPLIYSFVPGAYQMEPPSPLISWVKLFASRFINRTIFLWNALESHEWANAANSWHKTLVPISFSFSLSPVSMRTILFINLLGERLTPRACMGHRSSTRWAPVRLNISPPLHQWHCSSTPNINTHNPQSLYLLWWRANTQNISFIISLSGGNSNPY